MLASLIRGMSGRRDRAGQVGEFGYIAKSIARGSSFYEATPARRTIV